MRAALSIARSDGSAESGRVRIGIATGLVVVGEQIGEGEAWQQAAVGETPNLAARLQALAAPNTVVIAELTRRQIGGLFDLTRFGGAVAGRLCPAATRSGWCQARAAIVSRFEALRSEAIPLVGRDEELDLLGRRWQQARLGEGRVVLISGEPGIGKSRLTAALQERLGMRRTRTRWRDSCSPDIIGIARSTH